MSDSDYEGVHTERVNTDDLARFIDKLNDWGDDLDLSEKALLQIILERASASGAGVSEDREFPASGNFGRVVEPFLRDILASGVLETRTESLERRPWVKVGPIWQRAM